MQELEDSQFLLMMYDVDFLSNKKSKSKHGSHYSHFLSEFLYKYQDVITNELHRELPPKRVVDHKLELVPRAEPRSKAPYRLNQIELQELKRQLNELLERDSIRPNKSPFGAPVLFVSKKDGKFMMCVDYLSFNIITIKNNYPLSKINDLLNRVAGAKVFSRIDLKSVYYQIRIAKEYKEKMACRTRYGSYEFLVMPFGLCNALATFITLMNSIFHHESEDFVVVYIDNILIFSKLRRKHAKHLEAVLKKLKENKLYVTLKKSEFELQEIKFLKHILNQEGIMPDSRKIKVIK